MDTESHYTNCIIHYWAGLGDCPKCGEDERRADYLEAREEDRRLEKNHD